MSIHYNGEGPGKIAARRETHNALYNLNPELYLNSNHLYLSGPDAGDILEALKLGVDVKFLHAADIDLDRVKEAATKVPQSCVKWGDIVEVAKDRIHGKIGVLFLDVCGTLNSALKLLSKLYNYLLPNAIVALNFTIGRDESYSQWAHDEKSKLSSRYVKSKDSLAIGFAVAGNQVMSGIMGLYAAIAIAYKSGATNANMPMLTLVCKKVAKTSKRLEPAYFLRISAQGEKIAHHESNCKTAAAYKAHLPKSFKKAYNHPLTRTRV